MTRKLAEHLSSRRLGEGDWDNVSLVAEWLNTSLNRCGLVVAASQTKKASQPCNK